MFYCDRRTNAVNVNRKLNEAMVIMNLNLFMFEFASLETTISIYEVSVSTLTVHQSLACTSDFSESFASHDNAADSLKWRWQTSQMIEAKFRRQWMINLLPKISGRESRVIQ